MSTEYHHRPGDHCGSASLRNLAGYYEWGFDEPACFGLGAGIGFSYDTSGPASRMIMGRNAHLEAVFFDNLGIQSVHEDGQSRNAAWNALTNRLRSGPVLCFVDLYYLPYFGSDTHFGPHTVVVTDADGDAVTVSDSEFSEPQLVSHDAFDAAWSSEYGLGPLDRRWLAVNDPQPTGTAADATREAVELAAETMLHGGKGFGGGGVGAIRSFANDLPAWNTFDDVQWTARFAYQNIERRGTGGGAFRRLYADFLDTLGTDAGLDPRFGERMHRIADDWTTLGDIL
ncbi:MAG: hypothetical protein ACI80F_000616, partial [Natronomonas sp.]|uniref:BtrH N-terminal domain-containing protein n=1 Tax=Natronomonas sp. TaxID=2184060 RepID=UPI003989497D